MVKDTKFDLAEDFKLSLECFLRREEDVNGKEYKYKMRDCL